MAKDPAFLFYPGDWLGGTITFTRAQKGAYMDLLMAQFNQVGLTIEDIKHILGTDFWMWETKLKSKFQEESNGLYFNRKLREESIRRKLYTTSRRQNLKSEDHMVNHMETETVIETVVRKSNFIIPTTEEVKKYCLERKNGVDYVKWHNFYTAKGWKIGKEKMKDWQAAVRTWEQRKEDVKEWPKHPKTCTECFGNGYIIAPGSGGKFACREKY